MKNRSMLLCAGLVFWSSLHGAGNIITPKKKLTFLVYMAADNSLNPFVDGDLKEMQKVGSNENMNVLVYLNTGKPRDAKASRKLVIQKGSMKQWGSDKLYDSGAGITVFKACQWAEKHFPADRFVLVFWDHGSGSLNRMLNLGMQDDCPESRSVCYDDTFGTKLTDFKLRNALLLFNTFRAGKKIDIIAFDACLMADIEVAHTLAPFANYMVASQQTIPGEGYGYDFVLGKAAAGIEPRLFARAMIDAYDQEYHNKAKDYTLSAIDLGQIGSLTSNLDSISKTLISLLGSSGKKIIFDAIVASANQKNCTRFEESYYMDLGHFYANLYDALHKIKFSDAKQEKQKGDLERFLSIGIDDLSHVVFAKTNGTLFPHATGLSIYFDLDKIDATYPFLIWTRKTLWHSFLKEFIKNK